MEENDISKQILDAAIAVHKTLGGPGLLESVYRDALVQELRLRGLKAEKEVSVPVTYKDVVVGDPLRIDILVEDSVIVECKAIENDNPIFAAQTLTYLRLTDKHLGLLINFGKIRLIDGYQRVINGYTTSVPPCLCVEDSPADFNTESQSYRETQSPCEPPCLCASVLKDPHSSFSTQSHRDTEKLCEPPCLGVSVLKSSTSVLDWQAKARNGDLTLTNLYPDARKTADWLRRQAVVAVSGFEDCRLLVVHEGDFDRIFYAAKSFEAAAIACRMYADAAKIDCVLDVVGPQPVQEEAAAQLCEKGFSIRKSLTRMQRRKSVESHGNTTTVAVRPTTEEDAVYIHAALHQFFDARAEQLPCMEEVRELCTNGSSFVACEGNTICSFLLGEIQGKKGTIRYWFTTPEGRGKGTGGALMHTFFDLCLEKGATYQELWVIDDNENAIKRYEHYGFVFDRLKDSVFLTQSHRDAEGNLHETGGRI